MPYFSRSNAALWAVLWTFAGPPAGAAMLSHHRKGVDTSKSEPESAKARLAKNFGKLPLSFEANQGESERQVKFLARGSGYTLFLTANAAVLNLGRAGQRSRPPAVLRMKLVGANPSPEISGLDELPGRSNYFIGNDPKKWRANVPAYAKLRYRNTYPGVDLVYYGNQQQLEYDFVVAPGADPRAITLDLAGRERTHLEIAGNGDLVIPTSGGEVRFHKPVIYQADERSARHSIDGNWRLKSGSQVGFEVADYDRGKPLVIDPVLSYSTYLGGRDDDFGYTLAIDSAGNAHVLGNTASPDFPTVNPLQSTNHGTENAFVAELNAAGTAFLYSTYLGGSGVDFASFLALDKAGDVYITGRVGSKDFPTTPGAFQTKIKGHTNTFITKLNSSGSALIYSTYLGGTTDDQSNSIAVDPSGNAYIAGWTTSVDYPVTPGAFQTTYGGIRDAFVTELNAAGTALVYSTFLGGRQQRQPGIWNRLKCCRQCICVRLDQFDYLSHYAGCLPDRLTRHDEFFRGRGERHRLGSGLLHLSRRQRRRYHLGYSRGLLWERVCGGPNLVGGFSDHPRRLTDELRNRMYGEQRFRQQGEPNWLGAGLLDFSGRQ